MTILTTRSSALRRPYREAQTLRRDLIARGVPAFLVSATPDANLNRLDRQTPQRLTLVPDLEPSAAPEDLCPNLVFRPEGTKAHVDPLDETADERASTRYYLMRLAGFDADIPAGTDFDQSTPFDFPEDAA